MRLERDLEPWDLRVRHRAGRSRQRERRDNREAYK